jgi:flagellar basal-body rod protein FlgG
VVDGSPADRLRIVRFDEPQLLTRTKEGMFKDSGSAGATRQEKPEIKSGYIEMSNVNVVTEMVKMIDVQRSFETYQKIIRTIADLDKLAVSRVGTMA